MTISEGESGLELLDVASADGDVRSVPADKDSLFFEALAHESRYLWHLPYVEGQRSAGGAAATFHWPNDSSPPSETSMT